MFITWAVIFKTAEPLPRVRDRRHDLLRAPCAYLTRCKTACAESPSSSARKSPAWWSIVSTLARFRSGCSHPVPEPRSGSLAPSLGSSCVVSWPSACEVGARSDGPLTAFPRGAPPAAGGAGARARPTRSLGRRPARKAGLPPRPPAAAAT